MSELLFFFAILPSGVRAWVDEFSVPGVGDAAEIRMSGAAGESFEGEMGWGGTAVRSARGEVGECMTGMYSPLRDDDG